MGSRSSKSVYPEEEAAPSDENLKPDSFMVFVNSIKTEEQGLQAMSLIAARIKGHYLAIDRLRQQRREHWRNCNERLDRLEDLRLSRAGMQQLRQTRDIIIQEVTNKELETAVEHEKNIHNHAVTSRSFAKRLNKIVRNQPSSGPPSCESVDVEMDDEPRKNQKNKNKQHKHPDSGDSKESLSRENSPHVVKRTSTPQSPNAAASPSTESKTSTADQKNLRETSEAEWAQLANPENNRDAQLKRRNFLPDEDEPNPPKQMNSMENARNYEY